MADKTKRTFRNDHDIEFWRAAAISAMQDIQESGWKFLGTFADIDTGDTANLAFNMADSMLKEYHRRLDEAKERLKTCRDWYGEMGTGRIYEVKFGGDPIGKLVYEKE